MDAAAYLRERQVLWARRHGIDLQGSAGERGRPAYTKTLEQNLFEPLSQQARAEFEQGDGNELRGSPCKLCAVHSTAALAVNVFHYWKRQGTLAPILQACGLPAAGSTALQFEGKLPIAQQVNRREFPYDPNVDVTIAYGPGAAVKAVGIECKFTEVFRQHNGLKPAYLKRDELWTELPAARKLAEQISPNDKQFEFLHAAQLLKHILGLKCAHGRRGFRLLYLWCHVPGPAGVKHEQEIRQFAEIVAKDGIAFQSTTYQEVILRLSRQQRDEHPAYVHYLAERYL